MADPRKFARTKMQQQHKIEDKNVFEGEYLMNLNLRDFFMIMKFTIVVSFFKKKNRLEKHS